MTRDYTKLHDSRICIICDAKLSRNLASICDKCLNAPVWRVILEILKEDPDISLSDLQDRLQKKRKEQKRLN